MTTRPVSLSAQIAALDVVLANGATGLMRMGGHSRSSAELLLERIEAAKQTIEGVLAERGKNEKAD